MVMILCKNWDAINEPPLCMCGLLSMYTSQLVSGKKNITMQKSRPVFSTEPLPLNFWTSENKQANIIKLSLITLKHRPLCESDNRNYWTTNRYLYMQKSFKTWHTETSDIKLSLPMFTKYNSKSPNVYQKLQVTILSLLKFTRCSKI